MSRPQHPHPYYRPRQVFRHPHSYGDYSEYPPARVRVKRRPSFGGLSRFPNHSSRGGFPRDSEYGHSYREQVIPPSHPYAYSAIPTHPPTSHPIYTAMPYPYPPPLLPAAYLCTPIVPTYSQPYPAYPTMTPSSQHQPNNPPNFSMSSTRCNRSAKAEDGPGHSPRLSHPAAKLPPLTSRHMAGAERARTAAQTTTQSQRPPQLPCTPLTHNFYPFYRNEPCPNPFLSRTNYPRGLASMAAAWESHAQSPLVASNALVLQHPGESQMSWPPKGLKLQGDSWMVHPCLLNYDDQTMQISWKWDMNKCPTQNSVFELPSNGIVCPLQKEDLNVPVMYPPSKNKEMKIFVNDLPVKPLTISSDSLTVGSVFFALWEYLNKHIRDDWQDWLTRRHLQHVIPILEANRRIRMKKIGKLAATPERGRPPKWIDVFGDYVYFGGLIPLDQPGEFRLRHIDWNE